MQGALFWNRGWVLGWLPFSPSLAFTEPCVEHPSPTRPLQRQTTWAGRTLRDPASPTGRLVKSGSLGSARGAQPTVEAGVAHSECACPTHTPVSFPNHLPVRAGKTRARMEGCPVVGTADSEGTLPTMPSWWGLWCQGLCSQEPRYSISGGRAGLHLP